MAENSKKRTLDQVDGNPFSDLKIADDQILKDVSERSTCADCKKSVKYFCYKCHQVVGMERSEIPTVKLPVKLDVFKHKKEIDGKSTAIHARILAQENTTIYSWPDNIPEYENPERTLLLFPSPEAKTLKEIPQDSFDRIVVIDGTWIQANKIARDTPILKKMQRVTIQPRKTHFWRFQQVDDQHLATIEAIYYFYKEYEQAYQKETGSYDNLLFYYKFFYELVQSNYTSKKAIKFTERHKQKDYIKY